MPHQDVLAIFEDTGIGIGGDAEKEARIRTLAYIERIVGDQEVDQVVLRTMISSFYDGVLCCLKPGVK
jgi:hypothetical protein